jgi:GTP-binding protein
MLKLKKIQFEFSVGQKDQLPVSNLGEIVFSGRSNVGKSSLINKIFGRKFLARVSSKPGKTTTINFFKLENCVNFVDLPGYGYAKASIEERQNWSKLVDYYFNSMRNIILVVQIIDFRHPLTNLDVSMINFLLFNKLNFIIVATKSDKLNKTEYLNRKKLLKKELNFCPNAQKIIFSSVTNEGIDKLKTIIFQTADTYRVN